MGIQKILDRLDTADGPTVEKLHRELHAIKLDPEFMRITTGGGKNSPGPLNQRIGFVEGRLAHAFP